MKSRPQALWMAIVAVMTTACQRENPVLPSSPDAIDAAGDAGGPPAVAPDAGAAFPPGASDALGSFHSDAADAAPAARADAARSDAAPSPPAVPAVFTIDLSGYKEFGASAVTPLIASHQSVVVFPLDLRQGTKIVTAPAPADILEVQTKAPCGEGLDPQLIRNVLEQPIVRTGVPPGDVAYVERVEITMPYKTTPFDGYRRGPGVFCYGYRTADGRWHWQMAPLTPVRDDMREVGMGFFDVRVQNVDAIAILFHETSHVRTIAVIAEPTCRLGTAVGVCAAAACQTFCEARQQHIQRCGERALIKETLADCLATQIHADRCPTDPSRGGWLDPVCVATKPKSLPARCTPVSLAAAPMCQSVAAWVKAAGTICGASGLLTSDVELRSGCGGGLFADAGAICCPSASAATPHRYCEQVLVKESCGAGDLEQRAMQACAVKGWKVDSIIEGPRCGGGFNGGRVLCCGTTPPPG